MGPELKLHQCGLPKAMAVELFKPFIIHELEKRGEAETVKRAKKIVERDDPKVYEVLEDIIKDHPVLLNRAPTLHRLGIQAFEPVLVEGKAIRIPPACVCGVQRRLRWRPDGGPRAAFVRGAVGGAGADALEQQHSAPVQRAARRGSVAGHGDRRVLPDQTFLEISDLEDVAYNLKTPRTNEPVPKKLWIRSTMVRPLLDLRRGGDGHGSRAPGIRKPVLVLGSQTLRRGRGGCWPVAAQYRGPRALQLHHSRGDGFFNQTFGKKELGDLIFDCFTSVGLSRTTEFLDHLKDFGFRYATMGGVSVGIADLEVPEEKPESSQDASEQVARFQQAYASGYISNGERYNKVIDTWTHANNDVADAMVDRLARSQEGFNPVYMMMTSGAEGIATRCGSSRECVA